jgi:hypothetical protein
LLVVSVEVVKTENPELHAHHFADVVQIDELKHHGPHEEQIVTHAFNDLRVDYCVAKLAQKAKDKTYLRKLGTVNQMFFSNRSS